jgi:multiple sugar transport system ATP-binding protein
MGSIELKQVRKEFGGHVVIPGNDLKIENGEFAVFVGPSGCGKSTLLRMIAGLEDLSSGQILIDGQDVSRVGPSKRGLSMVFQSYALYPHMTVRNNIAFALKMAKQDPKVIDQKVAKAAGILNLTEYLDRRPGQLSGGQRQRVAIGRAIVREPKAFLFDEPLSNLDAALRVQMRLEIGDLHNNLKTTMIYVTHDQVEAMTMADKIVVLYGAGQPNRGAIAQIGSPMDLYNKPNNLFVAKFIGSPTMNVVTGDSAAKRGATSIGIRPEHTDLSTTAGEWPGKVRLSEHLGSDTFVYVDGGPLGQLTVRREGDASLTPGQPVFVTPQEARLHKFDKDGNRIG